MTADQWTHHDPAVRELIRRAQADAWEDGFASGVVCQAMGTERRSIPNPHRDEVTR